MLNGNISRILDLAPLENQQVIKADTYQRLKTADDILNLAQRNAEALEEKSRKAYEQQEVLGFEQGMADAYKEYMSRAFENARYASNYMESLEEQIVDIVISSVNKIIADIDVSELARKFVTTNISRISQAKFVEITVNPSAKHAIEMALQSADADGQKFVTKHVIVKTSDTQSSHTFSLRTPTGVVELNINEQVESLRLSLASIF